MSDLGIGELGTNFDARPNQQAPRPSKQVTPKVIREHWDRSQRSTRVPRQDSAVNEQFVRNRHWLRWNRGVGQLEEMPRNPDRMRATVNRVGPDTHRLIAKLTSRDLVWEVPPNSPDDQAIEASRVAEAALAQVARDQCWEDLRYDHALDTFQGGVAGICVEWDSRVGTPIGMMPDGKTVHTGDVKLTTVPIHEIAVEPGTRNAELGLWWVHGRALPPTEVQELYELAETPKADARAVDGIFRLHQPQESPHTPMTMVFTYYERPSFTTQGQIITVVGEQVVHQSPWYFPFRDRLNLCTAVVQPISGKWFGHTPLTDAIPVQTALNASWSSIIEHQKLAGNARNWIPEGSVENIEDLSDMAGEHVEYIPINGMRPGYEAPPVMPEWWVRAPDHLGRAMDDILGQNDVSRGNAPGGVESGIAFSVLSENADTPIGRFGKNLALMWGRVGSITLKLYAEFVKDSREAQIIMPGNRLPELVQWNGNLLHGHTTAIVPMDAVIPRSRSAQQAYAFQLHDRGLIQDPVSLARIADLPDQDDLIHAIDPDTAKANRENAHLAAGAARVVDMIDDHRNHILHHRRFMLSQRYENLPQPIQENFRLHMSAHEQYAAALAAQNANAASVSPIAAALPTEYPNPLDPQAVAEAAMLSEMAPSAATRGLGQGGDMPMAQAQLNAGGERRSGTGCLPRRPPLPRPVRKTRTWGHRPRRPKSYSANRPRNPRRTP